MQVTYGRSCAYSIQYHIVWSTNHREKFINGDIKESLIKIFQDIAKNNHITLIDTEIKEDYIHLCIGCSPQNCIPNFMKAFKGGSTKQLLKQFSDDVIEKFPDRRIWNKSYLILTASEDMEDHIDEYLKQNCR